MKRVRDKKGTKGEGKGEGEVECNFGAIWGGECWRGMRRARDRKK